MKKQAALLACTLILAGCGNQDKTQELQQQKMTLDLMKAQNEQLEVMKKNQEERTAELTKKENEFRALAKTNQEFLNEIEQQKVSLEKFKENLIQENKNLDIEKKQLKDRIEKLRADEIKNQKDKQEIAAARIEINKPESTLTSSIAIPKVGLTDKLRATCLVKVGDELADVELADKDGKMVSLKSLYGDALTVVFFWNVGTTPFSQQSVVDALGDIQKDVLKPFSAKDLRVVGINVGNQPEDTKETLQKSSAIFPNLLDSQGEYFKTVATEKLPRVYLLDASGKILWFDIDYARSTRRELQTAIKAVLDDKK